MSNRHLFGNLGFLNSTNKYTQTNICMPSGIYLLSCYINRVQICLAFDSHPLSVAYTFTGRETPCFPFCAHCKRHGNMAIVISYVCCNSWDISDCRDSRVAYKNYSTSFLSYDNRMDWESKAESAFGRQKASCMLAPQYLYYRCYVSLYHPLYSLRFSSLMSLHGRKKSLLMWTSAQNFADVCLSFNFCML